jgi:hypothetical protein
MYLGFSSLQGQEIFIFKASRSVLEPAQAPVNCGIFLWGKKVGTRSWPSPPVSEVGDAWRCTYTPLSSLLVCCFIIHVETSRFCTNCDDDHHFYEHHNKFQHHHVSCKTTVYHSLYTSTYKTVDINVNNV